MNNHICMRMMAVSLNKKLYTEKINIYEQKETLYHNVNQILYEI